MQKYSLITKASSRRSSQTRRRRIIAVAVVVLIVFGYVAPRAAAWIAGVIMQPIVGVERWLQESQSAVPSYIRNRAALEADRTRLEESLAIASILETERDILRAENTELRSLFATSSDDRIVAAVLAKPPQLPYDRLVVNKGSADAVTVGAPVYVANSVLVGTVVAVTPTQSIVELVTSVGVESTVFVFGPDIYTTAVGEGGGVLRIGVPQGIPLAVGNPVTHPAGSQGIMGTITHIETASTRPEQYGFVSLPFTLQSIRLVSIASSSLSNVSFEAARAAVDTLRADMFTVPVPDGILVDIPDAATGTATTVEPADVNTDISTEESL